MAKPQPSRSDAARLDAKVHPAIKTLPPEERAALKAHLDGWTNILTGIGLLGRDKRKGGDFLIDSLSWAQAEDIWRGNDLGAKIITKIPREMTRRGFDVLLQGDNADQSKEDAEAIEDALQTLEANDRLYDALCYERAYGGGAIFIGANDGEKDLRNPLNLNKLQSIEFLTAMPAQELYACAWYDNPFAPNYGKPARYRFQPQGIVSARWAASSEIHESRFLIFQGTVVSRRQLQANQGWGNSVLLRVHEVLSDFGQTWGAVAALLQDFAQSIYKIKGLAALVSQNKDAEVIKRVQLIDLMRSVVRGVLLDADEEYKRETTPLSGIPEILEQFALRMSAAADMPVSLLFGQAPAGLNATGASDIRFFYDDVNSEQIIKLKPKVNRLVQLLQTAKQGPTNGRVASRWSIEFRPLWQMTEEEQENLRYKVAQKDEIYIRSGVLTPEEVTVSRFGGDGYSTETAIDMEGRRHLKEADEPKEEQQTEPKADSDDKPRRGVYIALWPPSEVAQSIALRGYESPAQLHLTLAYLGKVTEFEPAQLDTLRRVVKTLAESWAPIRAAISGTGCFTATEHSDFLHVLYASVDAPMLPERREALVEALGAVGILVGTKHGFTPHITLAYLPTLVSLVIVNPQPFAFGELRLLIGEESNSFRLGGV